MPTSILLAGVGGQGIITASEVLAMAALIGGRDVKKSEVHGMSQRGGSVESHVRFSRLSEGGSDGPVFSPLIPAGEVDLLLGFEALEALRALPMTRTSAVVIADDRRIPPATVTLGTAEYPDEPLRRAVHPERKVLVVQGFRIACGLGEPRAANMVLLGAMSRFVDLPAEAWPEAIRQSVRPAALSSSLAAFEAGIRAVNGE